MLEIKSNEIIWKIRNKTLVAYEGYLPDDCDCSNRDYIRFFELEFRKWLDNIISNETDSIVIIEDCSSEDSDSHSAVLMMKKCEKCFPNRFMQEKLLFGLSDEERKNILFQKFYGNYAADSIKWNKYCKGRPRKNAKIQ